MKELWIYIPQQHKSQFRSMDRYEAKRIMKLQQKKNIAPSKALCHSRTVRSGNRNPWLFCQFFISILQMSSYWPYLSITNRAPINLDNLTKELSWIRHHLSWMQTEIGVETWQGTYAMIKNLTHLGISQSSVRKSRISKKAVRSTSY